MTNMFKKVLGFFICLFAVLLPGALRNLFSELLGWLTQFVYMNYVYLLKFMLKELEKAKNETAEQPESAKEKTP